MSNVLLIKERFNNQQKIEDVECPILLIHGKKDKLVSYTHSEKLAENANCSEKVKLCLNDKMEHNYFNMYIEIVNPIFEFFKEIGFKKSANRSIKIEAILNYHLILNTFLGLKTKEEDNLSTIEPFLARKARILGVDEDQENDINEANCQNPKALFLRENSRSKNEPKIEEN
jgi:hypothetical protein